MSSLYVLRVANTYSENLLGIVPKYNKYNIWFEDRFIFV